MNPRLCNQYSISSCLFTLGSPALFLLIPHRTFFFIFLRRGHSSCMCRGLEANDCLVPSKMGMILSLNSEQLKNQVRGCISVLKATRAESSWSSWLQITDISVYVKRCKEKEPGSLLVSSCEGTGLIPGVPPTGACGLQRPSQGG